MTYIIKITIASFLAMFTLGCVAFANLPDRQKLITFHENLITENQKEWKELNNERVDYQHRIDEIVSEMMGIELEADTFRETILFLNTNPQQNENTGKTIK